MLYNYLQRIYSCAPIPKWWYIWSKIKLYLLLKFIKRDMKKNLKKSSYEDFINIVPEFCSIVTDIESNLSNKIDERISVHIIEYIRNFNLSYVLRIDSTSLEYGEYSIRYTFNTRELNRLQFKLTLKNRSSRFSYYDGYIEKGAKYIISENIKDSIINYTKDIIYETMCIILDTISNRYILRKEVDDNEKEL